MKQAYLKVLLSAGMALLVSIFVRLLFSEYAEFGVDVVIGVIYYCFSLIMFQLEEEK